MPHAQNQPLGGAMGMRSGAVYHIGAISAGVRTWAWLTRPLGGALQVQGFGSEGLAGLEA